MPSFDVVCQLDKHEVENAVDQANREVTTRFDFKGCDAKFEYKDQQITMKAEVDFQLQQMLDILSKKLTKRGIDLAHMKVAEPNIQHKSATQVVTLQEGIEQDIAKKIIKYLKGEKIKVQAAIQGDQIRVTGKKRDDLQETIGMLKSQDFGLPLQFENFRD